MIARLLRAFAAGARSSWSEARVATLGPCANGHDLQSIGGCLCPHGDARGYVCSLTVLECTRCGACDYGEKARREDCPSCPHHDEPIEEGA